MNDFKSNPAPLVEIQYLTTVTSPDFKSGKKGETKPIEKHWAEQLVADGYAKFVQPAEAESAVVEHAEPIAEASEVNHGHSEQDEGAAGAGS